LPKNGRCRLSSGAGTLRLRTATGRESGYDGTQALGTHPRAGAALRQVVLAVPTNGAVYSVFAFQEPSVPNHITIATQVSIRDAGFDEYWLQAQIFENPACLGLGELEAIQRERRQLAGGRLDILLKDPEVDAMYEVEVMLGETDETHIIRTIEYWDNEKRRWPQRQHYAVLVAENINRRFFNVIHLLSHSIPIIAIQASLVESGGAQSLFFTTVLNTYEELDDGTATEEQSYDREFWNKKAKWVTEAADALLPVAAKHFDAPALRYLKQYISISSGSYNRLWFHKRTSPKALLNLKITSSLQDDAAALLDSASIGYTKKPESFRITIDKRTIEAKNDVLEKLMELAKKTADGKG